MNRSAVALSLVLYSSPAAADGLRIEDAIRMAIQNNERARKAPLRVTIADAQVDRARDAFFPTLSASGSSTWKPDTKGANPANTGTLQLVQPLLNPSAFPQFSQQRHNRESERWGSVQDTRQLAFDTAKAFIQVLTAEGVLSSAKRKLESAKLNLESAQARAQAELNSTNDVTKAELQLATSDGQVATSEGNVQRAYIALSFLTGDKVQGPLVPPDNTTRAAKGFEHGQPNQVRDALARRQQMVLAAQGRRADLRSLHEKNEGLENSAAEPLYRLIPTVSASGQARLTIAPLPTEKALDEQVAVNLTWQIFDAGLRYADRKQRLAQLESSRLDERLLQRSVRNDIELALAALHAARKNFSSAEAAATAADKNAQETNILYQQGLAKAIEVDDANDKRFEAEVTREAAKLSMEQAYLDLRSALGFGPIDSEEARAP